MQQVGLWHITQDGPQKLRPGKIELEKHLEDWIEQDPDLLQHGLTIVGRQVHVEGGYVDLLGVDPAGRWAVIEIKPDAVYRTTIAQALDYASCIATMPYSQLAQKANDYLSKRKEPRVPSLEALLQERQAEAAAESESREIEIFVVGTGKAPGLERMVEFLAQTYEMPINVVLYDVFATDDGQQILARELSEVILPPAAATVEIICKKADRAGVGKEFRAILEAAQRHGLHPRPYQQSIMYTPPDNHRRMLFTVWISPTANRLLQAYIGPGAFAEFYPVTEEKATQILGPDGYRDWTSDGVNQFIASLEQLFEEIQPAE
jgi:Holliday junction resolvase-like predicted endonuclease